MPSPPPAATARAAGGDRLEGSIRALVEGNFEQLRGYLEQLQEAVARQGIGADQIMFGMPGEDDEDEDEEDGMDEGDDDDEEGDPAARGVAAVAAALGMGGMGAGGGGPVQIPEVEEAPLAELLAMGFPDQLSRNALLLHRNRLQPAVDWALSHVDDPQGNEPLSDDVLAAVYGPQGRGMGGPGGAAAFMSRRRPRLPPGQVDPGTLDSMVEMGFDRDQSARALAVAGNRLEDACQLILNGVPLPPLPEQHPQGAAAAAAGGEGGEAAAGGGGNVNAADVADALAGAGQAAGEQTQQQRQQQQQGEVAAGAAVAPAAGEEAAMMEHDNDDDISHDEDEDEEWESDGDDDGDLHGADLEHAMDLMFGGLGGGGAGGLPVEGDWMAEGDEEGWHSEEDGDYSDEEDEDEDDDAFEDDEGQRGEEGGVVPPPAGGGGAGEQPAAATAAPQEQPPASEPQQPAPSGGDNGGQ